MKFFFHFSVAILFFACKYNSGTTQNQNISDTTFAKKDSLNAGAGDVGDSSSDDDDSVKIAFRDLQDTLIYSERQFDNIKKYYPELTEMYPEPPDEAYVQTGTDRRLVKKEDRDDLPIFSSEGGIDEYYLLYAYFLKKRNGERRFRSERKTLKDIYRDINSIHSRLEHGGSGFGHMACRIEGYAEYGVYEYANYRDSYEKKYSITKQKQLFLSSLKQFIVDEAQSDTGLPNEYKTKRKKDMFSLVERLDGLISNYFYLNLAREFEYKNYQ